MNTVVCFQSIKTHIKSACFVGIGLACMGLMFAGFFESMSGQIGEFANMMPKGMEAILGDMLVASTPNGWLSVELFALFLPISLSVLGIIYAKVLIGNEEQSGTIELILASSVTRTSLLIQKFIALMLLLLIPALLLFLSIVLGTITFPFKPQLVNVFSACISGWVLGLGFASLTFAAQAITGKNNLSVAIGSGFMGISWALLIISKLVKSMKDYEVFSTFYYFDNPNVLLNGLDTHKIAVLITIVILGFIMALVGFQKRDVGH
ncbi:MAG: ABC transporter permease subunit [Alcaligenaceae bacterium]|nr:ABC transporter permease subunit [Alcaligenaceae bacterium]